MHPKIGFVILSHDHPEQLRRLTNTLTAMFEAPAIACHHDFTQCPLRSDTFPSNVRFVTPHLHTEWAHINVPLGALKCFEQLMTWAQPDWFILLSGSDYPVRSSDKILHDLAAADYDVFMDHREIRYSASPLGGGEQYGFARADWIRIAYNRYCAYRFWLPFPSGLRSGSLALRKMRFVIRDPRITWLLSGFQRSSRIYGGDFWFQANRKAVDRLLRAPLNRFVGFYRKRNHPEESLFHTILCNQADLRICAKYLRYSDWTQGSAHPKWLDIDDVPRILTSGAHFARKFRPEDRELRNLIDKELLGLNIG